MPKSPPAGRDRSAAPPRRQPDEASRRPWWQRRDGHSDPIRCHPWFLIMSIGLLLAWLAALATLAFWSR
ncbi:MAG: hypothetical protein K2Y37_21030 [Pirellulales bacterium]|nr:hypothetical protein [Pirellulales bacterium]